MKYLKNDRFMIKVLCVTSVLMFISLFFGNQLAATGLTVFFLNVIWIMYLQFSGTGFTLSKFAEAVNDRVEESHNNKEYGKAGVYAAVIPLMVLGVLVIVLNLIALFALG